MFYNIFIISCIHISRLFIKFYFEMYFRKKAEGLVHISQLRREGRVKSVEEVVLKGQTVKVQNILLIFEEVLGPNFYILKKGKFCQFPFFSLQHIKFKILETKTRMYPSITLRTNDEY